MCARTKSLVVAVAAGFVLSLTIPGHAESGPTNQGWLATRLASADLGQAALADLVALERIARANGGTRATGTPGFDESLRYVASKLSDAGYRLTYQGVPFRDFSVEAEHLRLGDGRSVPVLMGQYASSTPVGGTTAPVTLIDPAGTDTTPGCEAADYPAGSAGTIALVRTDGCTSAQHALAAGEAGMAALLLFDVTPSAPWTNVRRRTLGAQIPVGFLSQQDADVIAAQAPRPVTIELLGNEFASTTVNLFAETSGGRADNVVMAGAHLDSGVDGPGINDNGSSVAAVLQSALALAPYQHVVPNKVRFAFWGAEELIVIGSTYYVSTLTPEQIDAITLYLNYEMLGSSNFVRFVMDGDDSEHPTTGSPGGPAGSGVVEAVITQGYQLQRLPVKKADFSEMRSDSEPFLDAGIPTGGAQGGARGIKTPDEAAVFGGTAGQFYDPCYHQPCDDYAHLNTTAVQQSVRATAWAVGRFAVYADDVRIASGR